MGAPSRARVFIVEDEAVIALELEDHLAELGYEVVGIAMRAEQALALIPRATPDVVLMDVNLGPGPSGFDVAAQLRAPSGPAFLFLTAYSDEIGAKVEAAGAAGYVLKPFRPEALRAGLERALAPRNP